MLIKFKTGGLPKGKALRPTKQALTPFKTALKHYLLTTSFSQGLLKPGGFASTSGNNETANDRILEDINRLVALDKITLPPF